MTDRLITLLIMAPMFYIGWMIGSSAARKRKEKIVGSEKNVK